jgi:hypothetical protein
MRDQNAQLAKSSEKVIQKTVLKRILKKEGTVSLKPDLFFKNNQN